ncbi:anti-sigma factor family protein [Streptomyces californicus]|uniref:anti-sigma factor family protein n=1 Tax=Streptomyces californicus TaxID=67351 RepID=UPI0036AFDB3D
MTSTADTTQHPEVSEISDLTEGLLTPSRTAEVRQHLADCDLCAEIHDSLEEVRGLLGAMPAPEPMPEDIAARIDAALAAEAYAPTASAADESAADDHRFPTSAVEEPASAVEEPVVVSRETTTGASASNAASSPSSSLPASNRPAGRSSAATGPGRRPATRRRRRAVVLGTAFGAAVIGASVFFLQAVAPSGDSSKTASNGVSAADSGADSYADGTLEARVQDLLAHDPGRDSPGVKKLPPEASTKSSSEALHPDADASRSPLRAPAVTVPPCVQQATGRTTPALALDEGTYEGKNAYLVVLPHTSDSSRVQAYLVAATCVDTAPDSAGHLLLTRAYDRP